MLNVREAIEQRRSIRKFKPDQISDEVIDQLLEVARMAPSGSNRQPWRFLVVTDLEERRQLKEICMRQAFVEEAPVVFVCCVDLKAYSQASRKARSQEFEDYGVLETLSGRVREPDYRAQVLTQPDPDREAGLKAAVPNVYIAVEHIVLMAAALGLGSCWVGAIRDTSEINVLFDLPDHIVPVAVLPVGYAATVPSARPRLSLDQILLRPVR